MKNLEYYNTKVSLMYDIYAVPYYEIDLAFKTHDIDSLNWLSNYTKKYVLANTKTKVLKYEKQPLLATLSFLLNHFIETVVADLFPDLSAKDREWNYLTNKPGYMFDVDFIDSNAVRYEVKRGYSLDKIKKANYYLKAGYNSINIHAANYILWYNIEDDTIYMYDTIKYELINKYKVVNKDILDDIHYYKNQIKFYELELTTK